MRPQRSRPVNLHLWVRILHKMVMHRLSENVVESAFRPGRYCDGGGLYLVVQPGGSKSWNCRVQRDGTRRDIGLGSAAVVTLADAREKARDTRDQIDMGIDPVADRPRRTAIPTLRHAAERVLEAVRVTWRHKKHAEHWQRRIEASAFPKSTISK